MAVLKTAHQAYSNSYPTESIGEIMWQHACDDSFPTDPLVRETFDFSKVETVEDETSLLGLYHGMTLIEDYSSDGGALLQQWSNDNTIAEKMIEYYRLQSSWYLEWFKKHQYVVDHNYVRPGGPFVVKPGPQRLSEEYTKECGQ